MEELQDMYIALREVAYRFGLNYEVYYTFGHYLKIPEHVVECNRCNYQNDGIAVCTYQLLKIGAHRSDEEELKERLLKCMQSLNWEEQYLKFIQRENCAFLSPAAEGIGASGPFFYSE